jgi:hypothetical protein
MKSRKTPSKIDADFHCQQGIKATRAALHAALIYVAADPEEAFKKEEIDGKLALVVDHVAERQFKTALWGKCNYVYALGEESLGKTGEHIPVLNLREKEGVVALVDMIDGTDLLERGMSNWCSAGCLFQPTAAPGSRILGSFVGIPSGEIYYSSSTMDEVRIKPSARTPDVPTRGCSSVVSLANASVCFYGQKAEKLDSIFGPRNEHDVCSNALLKLVQSWGSTSEFRIYNLAGIPMILKLIDHRIKNARNIDAVFELSGQVAHDVVPGAFLALKAKATVRRLWRDELTQESRWAALTLEDLEEALMLPTQSRLQYVITATSELADELTPLLLELLPPSEPKKGPQKIGT